MRAFGIKADKQDIVRAFGIKADKQDDGRNTTTTYFNDGDNLQTMYGP